MKHYIIHSSDGQITTCEEMTEQVNGFQFNDTVETFGEGSFPTQIKVQALNEDEAIDTVLEHFKSFKK